MKLRHLLLAAGAVCCLALATPTQSQAAVRYVCAADDLTCGGATHYPTLTAALSAAACGDVLRLKAGETFTGNFTLPNIGDCASNPVTITTTATSGMIPPDGVRPCYAASSAYLEGYCTLNTDLSLFPRLQGTQSSGSQNVPVLLVAVGARGWVVNRVLITNNYLGSGTTVRLGQNDQTAQPNRAAQPSSIYFTQVVMDYTIYHPYWMQKRGIELHCADCGVVKSVIEGANSPSGTSDAQSMWVCNGEGPYVIYDNWIRGVTEIVLLCGDRPWISTVAALSGTVTSTSATFNWAASITTPNGDCPFVGQTLAFSVNGATAREYPVVTGVTGCTATTAVVTWSPAIVGTLDNPGEVRYGVNPGDCAIKPTPCARGGYFAYNTVSRNLAWRNAGIVATPTTATASAGTGGSLPADTYDVVVQARLSVQGTNAIISAPATAAAALSVSASGSITWSVDPGHADVTTYRVTITHGGVSTYTDFGTNSGAITSAGTVGTPATASTRAFKFGYEEKAAVKWVVEYNDIFNFWATSAGSGAMITIKTTNQGAAAATPSVNNNAPWLLNVDTTIQYNVLRHGARAFSFNGTEYENGNAYYKPVGMFRAIAKNNLAYDITTVGYGGSGTAAVYWGSGCDACAFEHNTMDVTTGLTLEPDGNAGRGLSLSGGFIFRNNFLVRNTTSGGIKSAGLAEGTTSIVSAEGTNGGSYTITANLWGNNASSAMTTQTVCGGAVTVCYPVGNTSVTYAAWRALFTDAAAANIVGYKLPPGSAYANAATDNGPIGVELIDTLYSEVTRGRTGTAPDISAPIDPEDPPPVDPPPVDPGGPGPTRFYLTSELHTGVTVAYGPWDRTGAATRYQAAVGNPLGTVQVAQSVSVSTATSPEYHLMAQHVVNRPLAAQIISGTVSCQVRGRTNNASMHATLALTVRVVSSDGNTVRGTLLSLGGSDTATVPPELQASGSVARNRSCRDGNDDDTIILTPVTTQAGDLLVFETGVKDHDTGTSRSATLTYGDGSDTDLPVGDVDYSAPDNSWVEITDGILFVDTTPVQVSGGRIYRIRVR